MTFLEWLTGLKQKPMPVPSLEPIPPTTKFCVNCKWCQFPRVMEDAHRLINQLSVCTHPAVMMAAGTSPVTGRTSVSPCWKVRQSRLYCTREGDFFEPVVDASAR